MIMAEFNDTRQNWVDEYSGKIFQLWGSWGSPLGVDDDYIHQVRCELDGFFDDPLKRELIEETY